MDEREARPEVDLDVYSVWSFQKSIWRATGRRTEQAVHDRINRDSSFDDVILGISYFVEDAIGKVLG